MKKKKRKPPFLDEDTDSGLLMCRQFFSIDRVLFYFFTTSAAFTLWYEWNYLYHSILWFDNKGYVLTIKVNNWSLCYYTVKIQYSLVHLFTSRLTILHNIFLHSALCFTLLLRFYRYTFYFFPSTVIIFFIFTTFALLFFWYAAVAIF